MSQPTDQSPRGSGGPAPPDAGPARSRLTARREQAIVLQVLRGEPMETISRELGVTVAILSGWRDRFLSGGTAAIKCRIIVEDP